LKLEDQVCSLELSKRLKELGVKQESLFWWNCVISSGGWLLEDHQDHEWENCSAFTVAELGEMLPRHYASCRFYDEDSPIAKEIGGYKCFNSGSSITDAHGRTEADARASMLIHLIEINLWTPAPHNGGKA
jgi:hypothetical protein